MTTLERIARRKIVQWAVAYLAAGWLVMQVAQWLTTVYAWPPTLLRILPVLLFVGLLIIITVAWFHGEVGKQRVNPIEIIVVGGIVLTAAVGAPALRRSMPVAEQGAIAVLPFTDMSVQQNQAYFSDGLTEELLNVLAQIPELRVAARTSSFSFRDKSVPVDSIGRALHVEYVVEGSVRTVGDRVRITAQLINAATGFHRWSDTYDRRLQDIFAVQDEISRSIVQALELQIMSGTDTTSLARAATSNPKAHELVMKGNFLTAQRTRASLEQAVAYFSQAIAIDKHYAAAQAGLANALQYQAYRRDIVPAKGYQQAKAAAQKAIQLDASLADGHAIYGRILDLWDWEFKAAEKEFRRAIALNPGLADAHMNRAWLLMRLGDARGSIEEAQRAVALNPVAPNAYNTLGSMYSYIHRTKEALEAYRNALAILPDRSAIECNLMMTYMDAGRTTEALAFADKLRASDDRDHYVLATQAYVYAKARRLTEARQALRKLEIQPDAPPYLLATAYVALGQQDKALDFLDRAVDEHDDYVADINVDPVFDSLHDDRRFLLLLKRLGLPRHSM